MSGAPALTVPPPGFLADPGLAAVLAALPEARVVGGAVRDALAGCPVADIDLATPRRPEAVSEALRQAGLKAVPTGLDHGTVTAVWGGRGFEVTTLRRDVATDGRHAVVAFTEDWREDAARRDFTINALSMTRTGAVFDYFGGIGDLHAGRLRFVGNPAERIAEDYLRILRFFRFYARYARGSPDGGPDPGALAAIRAAVPGLARLSAERVWNELGRILAAPDPREATALMARLGVLAAVIPEGTELQRLARLVAAGTPVDPLLRLAALLTGDDRALAERLRLSGAERERLAALRAGPIPHPQDDDAMLRRLLADTDAPTLINRAWLAEALSAGLSGSQATGWSALRHRLAAMPRPVFPLEGRDVLALGVLPGPRVGALLREVRAWWLADGCTADAEACRRELAARALSHR
ncbi:MAG: CCA tRNA nucleotidyltransferase [Pseudomonadota bacterium]|nr:CCA tRNA nucleotidyltransferase [Pseudomonadota bacterium]